jgi:transcriptional regulator with XRE-family HTH domain
MNASELKAARRSLGWSVYQMADALRLAGDTKSGGDYVRDMENGKRPISGPVSVAVESFLRPPADEDPEGVS